METPHNNVKNINMILFFGGEKYQFDTFFLGEKYQYDSLPFNSSVPHAKVGANMLHPIKDGQPCFQFLSITIVFQFHRI